jgi:hypothetical protein
MQGTGVELPEHRSELVADPLAGPDEVLMRSGQHLDRLGLRGVTGHLAVQVTIATHHLGEHPGIPRIRLRPGRRQPVPVTRDRERVHRVHLVSRGYERRDQQATVELDPDHDLGWIGRVGSEHPVDPLDALDAIGHPAFREHLASVVLDADVVMSLCPVDPDVDHIASFHYPSFEPGGVMRRTNGSVLGWHDIPPAVVSPHRPAGARSRSRARNPVRYGAHPPAARAQHALSAAGGPISP